MSWMVALCDGWRRIAEAETFDFRGVTRSLAVGDWLLECPASDVSFSAGKSAADVDTIRVLADDGFTEYPGIVCAAAAGSGGFTKITNDSEVTYQWGGRDLWELFARRTAFPDPTKDPTLADPTPWLVTHDERSGTAGTVLAAYLNANLGSTAVAARQVPGFSVVKLSDGESGDWSARLQPLDDLARRICLDGGLTIHFDISDAGDVTANIVAPRDLSDRYVLSDQGDLAEIEQRIVPPASTWTLAGGQGTGVSRLFRVSNFGGTGLDRVEDFLDQTSLKTAYEVQKAAVVNNQRNDDFRSVAAEVTEDVAARIRFGRDVKVGDLITVEVDNVRTAVPVTELRYEVNATQRVVLPVLGEASTNALDGLLRDVADLSSRFDRDID